MNENKLDVILTTVIGAAITASILFPKEWAKVWGLKYEKPKPFRLFK